MTKRFIPVLAACLFLMVGTAQAATSLAFPPPDTKGGKPLMQTLSGRATNRSFTAKPLSDKLLGDLLWAAYGVNRPNGKRTIPTAQNRQDLEIYVLRSDGAWLYDAPKHSLEQVSSSDLRNFLAGQGFVREAPVGLVYVTDTQKNSKELFAADRLHQVVEGSHVIALGNVIGVAGDEHDLHGFILLPHRFGQRHTVRARHFHVQK